MEVLNFKIKDSYSAVVIVGEESIESWCALVDSYEEYITTSNIKSLTDMTFISQNSTINYIVVNNKSEREFLAKIEGIEISHDDQAVSVPNFIYRSVFNLLLEYYNTTKD